MRPRPLWARRRRRRCGRHHRPRRPRDHRRRGDGLLPAREDLRPPAGLLPGARRRARAGGGDGRPRRRVERAAHRPGRRGVPGGRRGHRGRSGLARLHGGRGEGGCGASSPGGDPGVDARQRGGGRGPDQGPSPAAGAAGRRGPGAVRVAGREARAAAGRFRAGPGSPGDGRRRAPRTRASPRSCSSRRRPIWPPCTSTSVRSAGARSTGSIPGWRTRRSSAWALASSPRR